MSQIKDKIEILSVDLLDTERATVKALKRLARELHLEFGWHYLLDLTWILRELGAVSGRRIMDAGAGTGLIQWWLAQSGAEVISVDRSSRAELPLRFRARFNVQGLRKGDLMPSGKLFRQNFSRKSRWNAIIASQARELIGLSRVQRAEGRVYIYNQDLSRLADLADNSLDAIVAVSALEHNTPQGLEMVVAELLRVLKPGCAIFASLCASGGEDWYHEPSSGWCYSDATIRRLFCMAPDAHSNYDQHDALFKKLVDCAELRDGLASFYFRSDRNGMPWGKWNPKYIPVGVVKVKTAV